MGAFGTTGFNTGTSSLGFGPQQQPVGKTIPWLMNANACSDATVPVWPICTALTDPNANAAQQAMLQQQLNILAYSPYGDSPLFRNPLSDPKKKEEVHKDSTLWPKSVNFTVSDHICFISDSVWNPQIPRLRKLWPRPLTTSWPPDPPPEFDPKRSHLLELQSRSCSTVWMTTSLHSPTEPLFPGTVSTVTPYELPWSLPPSEKWWCQSI